MQVGTTWNFVYCLLFLLHTSVLFSIIYDTNVLYYTCKSYGHYSKLFVIFSPNSIRNLDESNIDKIMLNDNKLVKKPAEPTKYSTECVKFPTHTGPAWQPCPKSTGQILKKDPNRGMYIMMILMIIFHHGENAGVVFVNRSQIYV